MEETQGFRENLVYAIASLRRVEHQLLVSTKFTKTLDMIKNIVESYITTYDYVINGLLDKLIEDNKIEERPIAPKVKCDVIVKYFQDDKRFPELLNLYLLLRRLRNAEFLIENEFKKKIIAKTSVEGREIHLDIVILTEYFKILKDIIMHVKENYFGEDKINIDDMTD